MSTPASSDGAQRELPAALRATVAEGWRQLNDDGRFGAVTESRVRDAIAAFERGVAPADAFSEAVYGICEQMLRVWNQLWSSKPGA